MSDHELRLLDTHEVLHKCGMGRTRLHELVKSGDFPAPRRNGRSVRWKSDEVDRWINGLPIDGDALAHE